MPVKVFGLYSLWRLQNGAVLDRLLIFIGHSFGGLVIEQAVVQANSAGGRYEYLVKLIGGVILLGTPHRGSGSQKWGLIVANLKASFSIIGLFNYHNRTGLGTCQGPIVRAEVEESGPRSNDK